MPVNYTWPELTAQGDYCILPQSSVLGDFKKSFTLKAFPQSTWNKILETEDRKPNTSSAKHRTQEPFTRCLVRKTTNIQKHFDHWYCKGSKDCTTARLPITAFTPHSHLMLISNIHCVKTRCITCWYHSFIWRMRTVVTDHKFTQMACLGHCACYQVPRKQFHH